MSFHKSSIFHTHQSFRRHIKLHLNWWDVLLFYPCDFSPLLYALAMTRFKCLYKACLGRSRGTRQRAAYPSPNTQPEKENTLNDGWSCCLMLTRTTKGWMCSIRNHCTVTRLWWMRLDGFFRTKPDRARECESAIKRWHKATLACVRACECAAY